MHSSCSDLHKSPEVRFDSGGPYQAPAGKDFPLHCHEVWEVIYYRQGVTDSIVGNEVFLGQPGVVVPIPPRVAHAERSATGYSNYFLQIKAPFGHPWPKVCYDDDRLSMGHVCESLVHEWFGDSHFRNDMIELLTAQLDFLLQRCFERTSLGQDELIVRRAQSLIQERLYDRVRIAEIAQEVGVSPSHLRALFVRLLGESPMDYLQAVRVRAALGLLRKSDAAIENIAIACGYDSASHLSRHIKRATGSSPGALRRMIEREPMESSGDYFLPNPRTPDEARPELVTSAARLF